MKHKTPLSVFFILGLATLITLLAIAQGPPAVLGSDTLIISFDVDEKIKEAELIVIGEVTTTLPSRWNGPDGGDPKNASPEDISRAHGLFTDSLVSINQILKGDVVKPVVRVRSFIGETQNVRWVNRSEPSYVVGKTYLLFLAKDIGATAKIDIGDYVAVGAYQGVYEIVDGRAVSADDEWLLEDLIAYIEQSLSTDALPVDSAIETPAITP